jgi:hypothetical protein
MLTQVLAMTVFGRAMEDAKNGVSTMMANAFVSPGLFREMNTLITDAGYGIDEYVMNLLMNPPRRNYPVADTMSPPPTIYTPFSLEVGFKRAPPMKAIVLQNRGVPATVRLLGASIKGDCPTQTANMYGKLRNTESLVRAAILIMFLKPEPGSSQEYLSDNADKSSTHPACSGSHRFQRLCGFSSMSVFTFSPTLDNFSFPGFLWLAA